MTTLTIKLPPNQALLILICTYVGAIYGGSRSAILLNIPGTPASAASCLDGHALARQGLAGRAMGIATTGSVLGTLIGMVCLACFTPVLGNVALKFGAYEFFWLALFGVIIVGHPHRRRPAEGLDRRASRACSSRPIGQEGAIRLRALHLRHARPRRRHPAGAGAGRRLRLRRAADGDASEPAGAGEDQPVRHRDRRAARRGAVLAHDPALGPDRHRRRHHPGRRRGRGGLVLVRGGASARARRRRSSARARSRA